MGISQHTLSDNLLAFTVVLLLVAFIYISSLKPKASGISATEVYSDMRKKDFACINGINSGLTKSIRNEPKHHANRQRPAHSR